MQQANSLTVVAAGAWGTGEFAQLRSALGPDFKGPVVASLAEALASAELAESPPDVILVAQPRPGTIDQGDVDRCAFRWPLTRIILVAGAWCEGELRTGRPPQGVVRLYWYELAAWWRAALAQTAAGNAPPWAEPLLDVRAGQFICTDMGTDEKRCVAIDALDYETFESLHDGLSDLGWDAVWQPRHRPQIGCQTPQGDQNPVAGIWDGGQLDEGEREALRNFCGRLRDFGAPVVALLDFPRSEHPQAARECGAAAIFAKPYQLSLVHQQLLSLTVNT